VKRFKVVWLSLEALWETVFKGFLENKFMGWIKAENPTNSAPSILTLFSGVFS
jgi:hypothetical protein